MKLLTLLQNIIDDTPSLIQPLISSLINALQTSFNGHAMEADNDNDDDEKSTIDDKKSLSRLMSVHDGVLRACMLAVQTLVKQANDDDNKNDNNNNNNNVDDAMDVVEKENDTKKEDDNDVEDDDDERLEFEVAPLHQSLLDDLRRVTPSSLVDGLDELLSRIAICLQRYKTNIFIAMTLSNRI